MNDLFSSPSPSGSSCMRSVPTFLTQSAVRADFKPEFALQQIIVGQISLGYLAAAQ
jgi:hypothetical protein